MSLSQAALLPHVNGHHTDIPIVRHTNPSSLAPCSPTIYNQQLDSSSAYCQAVPLQTQHQHDQHSATNLVNQTATSPSFPTIETTVPLSPKDTHQPHSLTNMAQYGREHMGRNFVHFTQPFNAGSTCHDVDVNLNTSSKYSPLMTHEPLSHARTMAVPSNGQQAMSVQMGYSNDINGFQPVPDASFRQPGHPVHNVPAGTASMVMVAEDMSDGRDVYNAANRGYITTYDMSTIRTPLSPVQLHAWQFEEQQRIMDPGLQGKYGPSWMQTGLQTHISWLLFNSAA